MDLKKNKDTNLLIPRSVKEQFNLNGRLAVITGGAGFLGVQFAETISEMGGTPIILDFNKEFIKSADKKLKDFGCSKYYFFEVDITNEKESENIIKKIWNEISQIDILINCVALTKDTIEKTNADFFEPFENMDQKLWKKGIELNLTATQLMCKIVGKKMSKRGKGSIINIASDVGVISPNHTIYEADMHGYEGVDFNTPSFYSVGKAGVIHLTKYLATYWAKNNVRVNSISPAGVYKDHKPGFVEKLSNQIPMGRMALPNEFKGAIAFLCSDASSFVTGHNLVIDGGRTIW